MKLSEKRVSKLAKVMARQMMMKGAVKTPTGPDDLASFITKVINKDLSMEGTIEAEARELVSRQRNLPPPGTGEYQAAFQQAKRAIAARKNFKY